jgi:hypothetical protein
MPKAHIKRSAPFYPLRIYLDQLAELFGKAAKADNPALFLYRHHARTPLFMAESIARLLDRIYQSKKTAHALKLFKKLEDSLGKIDDYDHWVKQFVKAKGLKKEQLAYFMAYRNKALDRLNKKLRRKDFYLQRFEELSLKLEIDFNNAALITGLEGAIKEEMSRCFRFYESCAGKLTSIELQVHELRRKLRWLSMYAQSLKGIIVLKAAPEKYAWEKEFITRREKESPYHQLEVRHNLNTHITFNREAFYALGFVIEELGRIKDKGMKIEVFSEMLRKTLDPADPVRQATRQLKLPYTLAGQLQKAEELLDAFFMSYQVYQKLL